MIKWLALAAFILTSAAAPARVGGASGCGARYVLWGDGRHDDTAALNAWFRGNAVVWGDNGREVGAQISDHVFRLSAPVYISSGSGRTIARFQFVWPDRREVVSGGMIAAGADPDRPPVATGITKIGAAPYEGVPFHSPTPKPAVPDRTGCLVS
jgi:hypothetical protein